MNLIKSSILMAILAAAAIAEAKGGNRQLGSKASSSKGGKSSSYSMSTTSKSGKGNKSGKASYSYSMSASKSGKGSKSSKSSKGGKGSKGSYSYSMSFPTDCDALTFRNCVIYIVEVSGTVTAFQQQALDGSALSQLFFTAETARSDVVNNRNYEPAQTPQLEAEYSRCWEGESGVLVSSPAVYFPDAPDCGDVNFNIT